MRRLLITVAVAATALAAASVASAQTPPVERPFPSAQIVSIFVANHTLTGPGDPLGENQLTNRFKRGQTVVFKVFAAYTKTGKVLAANDATYAYIKVPGQSNLKLRYAAQGKWTWIATWTIPQDYPLGLVNFTIRFKSTDKQYGNYVQIPVTTSQLTVTT